jgi:hypothetical protein
MNRSMFAALVALALGGGSAMAQEGAQRFRLVGGTEYVAERCLPPCACPFGETRTPVAGSFVMRQTGVTPGVILYAVSAVNVTSRSLVSDVRLTGGGTYRLVGDLILTEEFNLNLSNRGQPAQAYNTGPEPVRDVPLTTIELSPQTEIMSCVRNSVDLNAIRTCFSDLDDGLNRGWSDGAVGIEDLLYFLDQFESGSEFADCDDGSGLTRPDGGVGIEDLLHYLSLYSRGC